MSFFPSTRKFLIKSRYIIHTRERAHEHENRTAVRRTCSLLSKVLWFMHTDDSCTQHIHHLKIMLFRGIKNRLESVYERKIGKIIITLVTLTVFLHQLNTFLIIHSSNKAVVCPNWPITYLFSFEPTWITTVVLICKQGRVGNCPPK